MGPRARIIFLNLLDALLLNGAVLLALLLRFDGRIPSSYLGRYLEVFYVTTVAGLFCLNLFKVHRTLWRYVGLPTALSILNALTLAYGCIYVLNLAIQPQPFPRSVVVLSWILSLALVVGIRFAWRTARSSMRRGSRGGRRILIVGAGDVGAMVARELARTVTYPGHPVGFVDDDPNKQSSAIENLDVLGTTFDLPRIIKEKQIEEVIIAAPSAPARLVRQVVRVCQDSDVTCRTVPSLADYIEGKGALGQVREVRIEDLLGRDPIAIDLPGIQQRVMEQVVLVTGAGGSIGSELCRQVARFKPGKLIILDHNENALTYLGLELQKGFPGTVVLHVVGDIKDAAGMRQLFEEVKPDLVFHAAAHKHVNLLETRPREAILNNVMGTRNVALACDEAGVDTFVLISTDKAVNPASVMGASKRVCEMFLQGLSRRSKTTMVAVRFGNVIGSEGSVLPIFHRQLAQGGPLRVTHPEARRYFMTIPEASQLVIQSALLGQSGDIFILDMGEQVRILDVARQLIRLNGLEPDRDIRIEFTGLRPGEKIEEELLTRTEKTRTTCHAKIFRCELEPVEWEEIERQTGEIIEQAFHDSRDRIRDSLRHLVPEYRTVPTEPAPASAPVAADTALLEPLPKTKEPVGKRVVDVIGASISLLLLALPAALAWTLIHLSGPGSVTFRVERRIGLNRRHDDRRVRAAKVGIDRRGHDRRIVSLPGRPFVTYRMALEEPRKTGVFQVWLASWIERMRLDRLLFLWNVLRGDMSFVGPSSHLLESDSWRQDQISAWCFARRPGLTGPAELLGGGGEEAVLCDRYYGRHANWHLDLDALRRALPRLLKVSRNSETELETESETIPVSARQSGKGRGVIP